MLAVRVLKAFPPDETYAPVTAFEIATAVLGTSADCNPTFPPAASAPGPGATCTYRVLTPC